MSHVALYARYSFDLRNPRWSFAVSLQNGKEVAGCYRDEAASGASIQGREPRSRCGIPHCIKHRRSHTGLSYRRRKFRDVAILPSYDALLRTRNGANSLFTASSHFGS